MLKPRHAVFGMALLLAIIGDSLAESRRHSHNHQPVQTPSTQSTQPPAADQRGTDQIPFSVKIVPGERTKEQAEKEERERREGDDKTTIDRRLADDTQRLANETKSLAEYTFWLDVFTIFLVFAAISQIGLFVWQLRLIRQSLEDAKKAADAATVGAGAAKQSADATIATLDHLRDTARRQLRAYVFVAQVEIVDVGTDNVNAAVIIRNRGQTPAYDVTVSTGANAFNVPGNVTFTPTPVGPDSSRFVLGPDGLGRRNISLHSIIGASGALYVWGEILYKDAFGEDQYTRFRHMIGGGTAGWPSDYLMTVCPEGNEAS
jgi:hypothetical protein